MTKECANPRAETALGNAVLANDGHIQYLLLGRFTLPVYYYKDLLFHILTLLWTLNVKLINDNIIFVLKRV